MCHVMCLVSLMDKIFSKQHTEIFFLFVLFTGKNKKNINLSSAELAESGKG